MGLVVFAGQTGLVLGGQMHLVVKADQMSLVILA